MRVAARGRARGAHLPRALLDAVAAAAGGPFRPTPAQVARALARAVQTFDARVLELIGTRALDPLGRAVRPLGRVRDDDHSSGRSSEDDSAADAVAPRDRAPVLRWRAHRSRARAACA